jgi:transposase, IS30 family
MGLRASCLCKGIADEINDRPRKRLGVRPPLAVYRELLLNSSHSSTLIH